MGRCPLPAVADYPHADTAATARMLRDSLGIDNWVPGFGIYLIVRLADGLVIRDREGDDRRLCLECTHLQGYGRWHCGNWQAAEVAQQGLARDLVLMLQRCGGFVGRQGLIKRRTNDQA